MAKPNEKLADRLENLFAERGEQTGDNNHGHETCDSSCTTGYDNDGSTGYEIFENGVRYGITLGEQASYVAFGGGSAFFFAGDDRVSELCDKWEKEIAEHEE